MSGPILQMMSALMLTKPKPNLNQAQHASQSYCWKIYGVISSEVQGQGCSLISLTVPLSIIPDPFIFFFGNFILSYLRIEGVNAILILYYSQLWVNKDWLTCCLNDLNWSECFSGQLTKCNKFSWILLHRCDTFHTSLSLRRQHLYRVQTGTFIA